MQDAPLYFVSPGQVNVIAPSAFSRVPVTVVEVVTRMGVSERVELDPGLTGRAPGVFTVDASGCGPPAVLNVAADGSVSVNSPFQSAEPGGIVTVFLTGMGSNPDEPPDGHPVPTDRLFELSPIGAIIGREGLLDFPFLRDGELGPVTLFTGKAPGTAGVDQINLRLPDPAEEGCRVPLRFAEIQGGMPGGSGFAVQSSQPVCISVRRGGGQCVDATETFGLIRWRVRFTGDNAPVVTFEARFTRGAGNLRPRFVAPEWFQGEFFPPGILIYRDYSARLPEPLTACPDPTPRQLLDAGILTISGPGAPALSVPPQATEFGPRYRAEWRPQGWQSGAYTVRGPGGTDVGAFETAAVLPEPIDPAGGFAAGTPIDVSRPLVVPWAGGGADARVFLEISGFREGLLFDKQVVVADRASRGELSFESLRAVPPPRWDLDWGDELSISIRHVPRDEAAVNSFTAEGLSVGGWCLWEYVWEWPGLVPTEPSQ